MPLTYKIEMDLKKDWLRYQSQELNRMGYQIDSQNLNDISVYFYSLARRFIPAIPRKVHIPQNFVCPPYLREGLENLIEKIEKGVELTPHLSRNIKRLAYEDMLLNDWGIHHLHLGVNIDKDGFVNRDRSKKETNLILFIRFTDTDAYVLKVDKHGIWTDKSLIQIIHDNWPDTIKLFKIKDASMAQKVTEKEHQDFRKSGATVFTTLKDGTSYFPLGIGYTVTKTSIEALRNSFYMHRMLDRSEQFIKNNVANIVRKFKDDGLHVKSHLKFILIVEDGNFIAWDIISNGKVLLSLN